jgi:predicted nuclease of restriction endonuclease-like (RecB) superfamily
MTKQPTNTEPFLTREYKGLLKEIKEKVQSSQLKAAQAVNTELVKLYWEIGRSVHERQKSEGWGAKTLEKLANDLKSAFPQMKGFSPRNLQYMVTFAREYSEDTITQQLVAQIPWGHNTLLLDKIKDRDTRVWYIKKTIENGWSRSVLLHWIDSGLHDRQGRALNNFERTLVAAQSDLAQETLKDPYNFDFLTLREQFDERELEDGLIDHVQKFLLELGTGFAFVGKQYPIKAGKKDLYIDLLFYHLKLRCYFIVELKAREFDSRDAGQMSAYLSAVDDILRYEGDNPSIGMILCKTKDNVFVEYVLRNFNRPIGVAEYETKIIESLPDDLKGSLPSIEEIEQELEGDTE